MSNVTKFTLTSFVIELMMWGPVSYARENVAAIIRRSVAANAVDWRAATVYDYFERDRQQDKETKTYQVRMILGSPYEQLVAVNGKSLSHEEQKQERQKLQSALTQRQDESVRERAERIAKYENDRSRDEMLMQQLTSAFDFVLLGQQKLGAHEVYVLKATPRADYHPPNLEAQVLKGMQGKLWIDQKTFQWVKVEAQVMHPVSIEGFLAQVEPGTRFALEKMPVADGVWLPSHFTMRSKSRVLFLFTHNTQADETYYGYHRADPIYIDRMKN